MRDQDIGFLPVCEAGGKVIGAVTDRDLALRVIAAGKPPTCQISEVLTEEVISCKPSDDVRDAERLMQKHQVQRLMVLDGGGLVGIISLQDLVQADERGMASTLKSVKSDARPAAH